MILRTKIFIFLLISVFSYASAQMQDYSYKRELINITNVWHKVILPKDLYKNASRNLSDLRVFGITATHDTIEASYLLNLNSEKIDRTKINFKILNTTKNEKGSYFTLEVPKEEAINQLQLDFRQFNFDWRVLLEGSQNQSDWFTIVDDYRILSIKNAETFYQYTNITFPNSKYHFFRLLIKTNEKPVLRNVGAYFNRIYDGNYIRYAIKPISTTQNSSNQSTSLTISLKNIVPVSYVNIHVNNPFDYYRPVTIQYVSDSIKSQKGYIYTYRSLTHGTLNSIETNQFKFKPTILKKLKITFDNEDNQPLNIDSVEVKGYAYELIVRFTEPATYYLTYGNPTAYIPNYDIERFATKVPDTLVPLTLGDELPIEKQLPLKKQALFENKFWLWGLIILMVLLLGGFTLKMMRVK